MSQRRKCMCILDKGRRGNCLAFVGIAAHSGIGTCTLRRDISSIQVDVCNEAGCLASWFTFIIAKRSRLRCMNRNKYEKCVPIHLRVTLCPFGALGLLCSFDLQTIGL